MRTWISEPGAFAYRAIPGRPSKHVALVLGLALLAGFAQPASAQVQVQVTLDQDQFLQGESVQVAVRISSRYGQTLDLGLDPDWLTFSIESRDGFVVAKLGDAPVAG